MEYTGNFHIHSLYSDGHQSIGKIASIAARNNLDFIIINDHETLQGLNDQGYQHGVLVLVGMEVNDHANHYLALNIDKVVKNNTDCPQQVIDEVNRLGGFGIIAHPIEKGSPLYQNGLTYPWTDWNVSGFQGIEIWNYLSQWRDGITGWVTGICLLLRPAHRLSGPYPEIMSKLDYYQQCGTKVMLYGGSDAHGITRKLGLINIRISPYELCFKMINIHIITETTLKGDQQADIDNIMNALHQGTSWIACDYFKNSRGFEFELRSRNQRWRPGSTVSHREGMYLYVSTPFTARVKLIRNGKVRYCSYGTRHIFINVSPGVYRIEAYIRHLFKYQPWIFSNPIWVI